MKKSQVFWQKLNKPIFALAPMAGVADSAFRQICKDFGADVVYSEMASATALAYNPKKTLELLEFSKKERPYVVQLFGSKPEHFAQAVKLLTGKKQVPKFSKTSPHPSPSQGEGVLLPDGIDINFGCPVKKVQKQGAGAVLMDDLKLSREIIEAVIKNTKLPISIKIRSKAKNNGALKFLDYMRDLEIAAMMIHGRTLAQGFSGEADWKIIKKARNYFGGIILANGGINTVEDGLELLKKTGADGVGIARGVLGKPWIFDEIKKQRFVKQKTKEEIFKTALKHASMTEKLKGEVGIREMRKHLCWYVSGLPNARELRQKLVGVEKFSEIKKILK